VLPLLTRQQMTRLLLTSPFLTSPLICFDDPLGYDALVDEAAVVSHILCHLAAHDVTVDTSAIYHPSVDHVAFMQCTGAVTVSCRSARGSCVQVGV